MAHRTEDEAAEAATAPASAHQQLGARRLVDQDGGDVPEDDLLDDVDVRVPGAPRGEALRQRRPIPARPAPQITCRVTKNGIRPATKASNSSDRGTR